MPTSVSRGSEDEERLIIDIFKGYNHLIRPVPNVTASSVEVSFSLAMILLINVVSHSFFISRHLTI